MLATRAGARFFFALLSLVMFGVAWSHATQYKPPPPPEQPIAYSHKVHVATEGIECEACHTTAKTEDHATLPSAASCMECHVTVGTGSPEIAKLQAFAAKKEDVPWKRAYRLPDYVYFSHKVHADAKPSVTCETCHGNVREMDQMQKVKDISMAACVDCHKQHSAPITCAATCHDARG